MGERLRRQLVLTESGPDDGGYTQGLMFSVDGMAGAVTLTVLLGNHRAGAQNADDETPSAFGPVGMVSDVTQLVVADMATGGLYAHAYRPWPEPLDRGPSECLFLPGGRCYEHDLEGPSLLRSTPMLMRLMNPGGVDETWEALEELWRETFVPELSPRAVAIEAARLAEARAAGAARALADAAAPAVQP